MARSVISTSIANTVSWGEGYDVRIFNTAPHYAPAAPRRPRLPPPLPSPGTASHSCWDRQDMTVPFAPDPQSLLARLWALFPLTHSPHLGRAASHLKGEAEVLRGALS